MTGLVIVSASPFLRYLWEHMLVRRYYLNTIKSRCYGIKSFISFIAGLIWYESNEVSAMDSSRNPALCTLRDPSFPSASRRISEP